MIELIVTKNAGDYEVVMMDNGVQTDVPGVYWDYSSEAVVAAKKLKEYLELCFPWIDCRIVRRDIY